MKVRILFVTLLLVTASACTEQDRAKRFGGNATIDVPSGHKLVNATWKESELWYLTRPMREGEAPETVTFRESSRLGLVEGTVTFVEQVATEGDSRK